MDDQHLRDFYAGLAMMALINRTVDKSFTGIALSALTMADAMMEERNRRKESEVNERT